MNFLTSVGKRKLRNYEESSLRRFCQRQNLDEREYSERLLNVGKTKLDLVFTDQMIEEIDDPITRETLVAMKSASDYLSMREMDGVLHRQGFKKMIDFHFDVLPINCAYVHRLLASFEIKARAGDREAVLFLIDAIPLTSSWDLEFNAYVTGEFCF